MGLGDETRRGTEGMIDNFALALSHGLIMLAAWRLMSRPDLDNDEAAASAPPGPRHNRFKNPMKGRTRA